jgi:amino acid permease
MKWLRFIAGLVMIAVTLVAPLTVRACPLCTEMVAAAGEASDDSDNFPEAVNQSIYVMVSVPYLSFAVVGFFVYRGVKQNREYLNGLGGAHDKK